MRVVEAPLGDGRAGDGGVEHVGATQHGERREVAAEAPAADRDPREVELGMEHGGLTQRRDLVVEHAAREVAANGALERRAAARRAAPVGDDDREPLVGEPLRREEGVVAADHALCVRPAVRIEQHRQRRTVVLGSGAAPLRWRCPCERGGAA